MREPSSAFLEFINCGHVPLSLLNLHMLSTRPIRHSVTPLLVKFELLACYWPMAGTLIFGARLLFGILLELHIFL